MTIRVKILAERIRFEGTALGAGCEYDLPDWFAQRMVRAGRAELAEIAHVQDGADAPDDDADTPNTLNEGETDG